MNRFGDLFKKQFKTKTMDLLKNLNIIKAYLNYENIILLSGEEKYFITPQDMLDLTMANKEFHIIKKKTRMWIEPV